MFASNGAVQLLWKRPAAKTSSAPRRQAQTATVGLKYHVCSHASTDATRTMVASAYRRL